MQHVGAQVSGKGPGAGPLRDSWRFGITSPRDGSIFAIDPDMPPAAQCITFEGEDGICVFDGKLLGAPTRLAWAPWPGWHQLTLLGRGGNALETVRFEARGAGIRALRKPR